MSNRTLKAHAEIVRKLSLVRVLYMVYYNSSTPISESNEDFFYAVGDILEGKTPENIDIRDPAKRTAFLEEINGYEKRTQKDTRRNDNTGQPDSGVIPISRTRDLERT